MKYKLATIGLALCTAAGAQSVSIGFSNAGEFAANFRQSPTSTGNTISQTGSFLTVTGNNVGTPAIVYIYDSTPSDTTTGTQSTFTLGTGQSMSASFDIANISSTGTASSIGFYFFNPASPASTVNFGALLNINGSGSNEQFRFMSGANLTTNPNGSLANGTPTLADGGLSLSDSTFRTITASYQYNSPTSVTLSLSAGSANSTITYTSISALSTVSVGFRVSPTPHASLTTMQLDNFTVSAVPEPSSFAAIAGLGALGAFAMRRRARG
jgi:hypothetical protein